jgi:hypothetical protein
MTTRSARCVRFASVFEDAAPPPPAGLPPGETDWTGARTLRGDTFQRPVFVDSAFTGSFIGDTMRAGFAPTEAAGREFHSVVLYDSVAFGYQVGPGVQLAFDGNARTVLGVGRPSLIATGGSLGLEALPSLRVVLARSPRYGYELTLHGSAILSYDHGIEPSNLIAIFADRVGSGAERQRCLLRLDVACAFPTSMPVKEGISNRTTSFGGAVALDYAQAFNRHAGVQVSGELSLEDSALTAENPATRQNATTNTAPFTAGAGIAPSYNFYPDVPLGLQAEYSFDYRTSSPNGHATHAFSNNLALGIYYTGRRDLQLGVNGTASFRSAAASLAGFAETVDIMSNAYTGGLGFFYYF